MENQLNEKKQYEANILSPTRNVNTNTAQVKITGHNHRRNYLSHKVAITNASKEFDY